MSNPREPGRIEARSHWLLLPAIVVLGIAVRLYRLNYQSVWYDEIFSLTLSHMSLGQMIQYLVKDVVHPPLHYFLLHVWFMVVGFGPYQARLLSVVFGTLAIAATYRLGDYLFGRRAAIIAALLLALSQLAVMYSQESTPLRPNPFPRAVSQLSFPRCSSDESGGTVVELCRRSHPHDLHTLLRLFRGCLVFVFRGSLPAALPSSRFPVGRRSCSNTGALSTLVKQWNPQRVAA